MPANSAHTVAAVAADDDDQKSHKLKYFFSAHANMFLRIIIAHSKAARS